MRECANRNISSNADGLTYLLREYYIKPSKPMRACHPRDLVNEILDIAHYRNIRPQLTRELTDEACKAYFVEL